jgi:hypothetical protein
MSSRIGGLKRCKAFFPSIGVAAQLDLVPPFVFWAFLLYLLIG